MRNKTAEIGRRFSISNGARKTILALLSLSFFALASTAFAQGFVPLAPIPGLTSNDVTSVVNTAGFADFFNNLYKYCIGLSAVLAVIMIIWGGLEISTKDSVSSQSNGRERITQAIYGLLLVLSPVLVFSIINPSILNLSLSLKPIDLSVPPSLQVQTPTISGPTGYYTDARTIPSGQFCYKQSISVSAGTAQFVCFDNMQSCAPARAQDGKASGDACLPF